MTVPKRLQRLIIQPRRPALTSRFQMHSVRIGRKHNIKRWPFAPTMWSFRRLLLTPVTFYAALILRRCYQAVARNQRIEGDPGRIHRIEFFSETHARQDLLVRTVAPMLVIVASNNFSHKVRNWHRLPWSWLTLHSCEEFPSENICRSSTGDGIWSIVDLGPTPNFFCILCINLARPEFISAIAAIVRISIVIILSVCVLKMIIIGRAGKGRLNAVLCI